jgi:hypothetical protein
LVVWSKDCGYLFVPDPVTMAARYGANTFVLDSHKRLVCSQRGGREVDIGPHRDEAELVDET